MKSFYRICKKCNTSKHLSQFYKHHKNRVGFICLICKKEIKRLYYISNQRTAFKVKCKFCNIEFLCNNSKIKACRKHGGNWKSGIIKRQGYFAHKINKQYKRENRIVIEKILSRKLNKNEIVHHINGNIKDNRPKNLELLTISQHIKKHWEQGSYKNRKKYAISD